MRYYSVSRKQDVIDRIDAAIEASGGTILEGANTKRAPFEYKVLAPTGEILEIVCYAFTANKYKQGGRPKDEHRFQIKYGSDFDEYHHLYFDPSGRRITLMFGVHVELDVFIAVDPAMYNPTWFSRSVEFKDHDLDAAIANGWHGWERERSMGRRKKEMPLANIQTEVLLGFAPNRFLDYATFERFATGQDTGERHLLIDKLVDGTSLSPGSRVRTRQIGHPLERLLDMPAADILDELSGAFRLLAAVRGSVAEFHLARHLEQLRGIKDVQRIDRDGQPDVGFRFEGTHYLVECKNVLRKETKRGAKVDFQKTRASKSDPCSRYYKASQFDVLAACLHPVSEQWEFRFCETRTLPPHPKCSGRLDHRVYLGAQDFTPDIRELLS